MDLDNQTINLGSNVLPNVTPLSSTISGQVNINNSPIDITTLGTSVTQGSDVLVTKQIQANEEAAAQVVTPSTTIVTGSVSASLDTSNVNENVNLNQEPVTEDNVRPEGTPVVNTPKFVMSDTFTVNTEMFKAMIATAKKAAVCISNLPVTTFFDITFDNDSLKIVSCNGNDVLVQINKNVGFKDTIHFNVEADFFANLISTLDCDTITFNFNRDTNYHIHLMTSDGRDLQVEEYYDTNSGKTVTLEKPEGKIQPGDIEIDIDGVQFKQLIQSAGALRCNEKIAKYLAGVYCGNKVYSTNSETMVGLPNLPRLAEHPFYINNEFVELLTNVDLNANAKIILRPNSEDNTLVDYIIVMDDKLTIYGPSDLDFTKRYPVNALSEYMDTKSTNSFTFEKSKLENILRVAELFVEPNTDKECCLFIPDNGTQRLDVLNNNTQAHQYVPIQGLNKKLEPFHLKIKDFLKVLSSCPSDTIPFEVDDEGYRTVRIKDGDYVFILAIQNL